MTIPNYANFRTYWNFDGGASTDADDDSGNGHSVIDVSSVGSTEGGRYFDKTCYFYGSENAVFKIADDYVEFGVHAKLYSLYSNQGIMGIYDTNSRRSWMLGFDQSDAKFFFAASSNGSSADIVMNDDFGTVSQDVKYYIHGFHNPVSNLIGIGVNDVFTTLSHSGGCHDVNEDFRIGAIDISGIAWEFHGVMWSPYIYGGEMTSGERTSMYNSGTPLKWNDIIGGGPTFRPKTFITFRDLDLPWLKKGGLWLPKNPGLATA